MTRGGKRKGAGRPKGPEKEYLYIRIPKLSKEKRVEIRVAVNEFVKTLI